MFQLFACTEYSALSESPQIALFSRAIASKDAHAQLFAIESTYLADRFHS